MAIHRSRRGLELPIVGEPSTDIDDKKSPARIAILAADYPGLRPTMNVGVGDEIRRGQLVFEDKKNPGVRYTAPGGGRVSAIHRGHRRAFTSLVIELHASERQDRSGGPDDESFGFHSGKHPQSMSREEVREALAESGEWTALRRRPFGTVARLEDDPSSIFVTAMDSNPLAPPIEAALAGHHGAFERGVVALTKLTEGPVFVCTARDTAVPVPSEERVRQETFVGPHPAGTVGYHIHRLDPVDRRKVVWYVNYQDVVAIGYLLESGRLFVERLISLAGPVVSRPRLLRTRVGASVDALVENELETGEHRALSGSVLSGRSAMGEADGYLGRYHHQVSVLREGREREFLGWLAPGFQKFSVTRAFVSKLVPSKKFRFSTTTHGSQRAIVPIGSYEKVMPMELLPTFLLRALVMRDVEKAEQLGCLELDEEDLGLCSFVCPSKLNFGVYLRDVLNTIEKEG